MLNNASYFINYHVLNSSEPNICISPAKPSQNQLQHAFICAHIELFVFLVSNM